VAQGRRPRHRGRPRAGHGITVLLKIHANCIDGQAVAAKQRISDALVGATTLSTRLLSGWAAAA
jgi:hypothetical protein